MRIHSSTFRGKAAGLLFLFLLSAAPVFAQGSKISIRVLPGSPGRVVIEGASAEPRSLWSFRDSYGGVLGLAARIENFELFDGQNTSVAVRKAAPGQFQTASAATNFKYEVALSPPTRVNAARVSSLTPERGLLVLGDLLPLPENLSTSSKQSWMIKIEMPAGWSAFSAEQTAPAEFRISDPDSSVIVLGKTLRKIRTVEGFRVALVTDVDWAFQDADAVDLAVKILKQHVSVFGSAPFDQASLVLLPFADALSPAPQWSAQTRGTTVTLFMGKSPSKVGALAQLGTALSHELFHLWVPNGLALDGDYDWFYEGFTVYKAASTQVKLDLLTFPEFLRAIAAAYDAYSRAPHSSSIIDASKTRFTGGEPAVYSEAMVIAFLFDLNLRLQSKNKRSLDDVYRELLRQHPRLAHPASGQTGADGNDVVVSLLRRQLDDDFVRRFILQPAEIDLQKELAKFGLQAEKFGARTHVQVAARLTSRQRDLLRYLGYNERTR